ncbi:MAG: hypothetical protein V1921_07110 [Candidatus Altiarchaeota archaeon]
MKILPSESEKNLTLFLLIFIVMVTGCVQDVGQQFQVGGFSCSIDSNCVIKEGQCSPGCYHKDEKPEVDPSIVCKARPWFKQERCECVGGRCQRISCEDMGLDYTECDK